MSEKQTPPFKDEFNLRQAAEASRNIGLFIKAQEFKDNHPVTANILNLGAVASIIGVGAATIGELTQPTAAQQAAYEHQDSTDAEATSYRNSISEAINAMYDSKAKIGEIDIALGDSLLDPSVNAVIAHIGEDAYHQRQSQIYNALKNSTLRLNPQPGEKYAVVETDIDSTANNGIEYVTVDISHVLASEGTKIPAPNTH